MTWRDVAVVGVRGGVGELEVGRRRLAGDLVANRPRAVGRGARGSGGDLGEREVDAALAADELELGGAVGAAAGGAAVAAEDGGGGGWAAVAA